MLTIVIEIGQQGSPSPEKGLGNRISSALSEGDYGAISKEPVVVTFALSALGLAIFALIQSNMFAQLLPESLRMAKHLSRKHRLSKEERAELENIQSIVQLYLSDHEGMQDVLEDLKHELSGKEIQGSIPKGASERLSNVIERILNLPSSELSNVADSAQFFGLVDSSDAKDRFDEARLEQSFNRTDSEISARQRAKGDADPLNIVMEDETGTHPGPSTTMKGEVSTEDGYEWLQWPEESGLYYYRTHGTGGQWLPWTGPPHKD